VAEAVQHALWSPRSTATNASCTCTPPRW
jgi:hypothetical protein